MQQIDAPCGYQLAIRNAPIVSVDDLESKAGMLFLEACDRKCDPAMGPLFDISLVKFSDHENLLVWHINNIITDAFSLNLMFRELWSSYSELLQARPQALQAAPESFADYANWQQISHHTWLEKHDSYWRKRMAGAVPIQWPIDGPITQMKRGTLASVQVPFGNILSTRLRETSRCARILLPLVMLTLFVAVASRWCKQKDLLVPFQITGRNLPEHQCMIGYLVQHLYLRIQLSSEETFLSLMNEIRQEFYRALLHQDYGRVALESQEEFSRTCFQWWGWRVDEVFGRPTREEAAKINVTVRKSWPDFGQAQTTPFIRDNVPLIFDFVISFSEDPERGIRAFIGSRLDVFPTAAVERFSHTLLVAAEQLAADPHASCQVFSTG
jgi:hypothetical protein